MKLIEVLASGVVGATGGTATVYSRGTALRATLYADAEATSQVPTASKNASGDLLLDDNGGFTVYVDESVDVTVKSSTGATVRTFTQMVASPLVEYIGPSFTGIDYESAASAVNKPVTLKTILDLWKTSAGAVDFNVLFQGSSQPLQDVLISADIFYNVKSTAYGALGDGATNDAAAIQAAIDAANAAGGGTVFFPPGTYRVTATLTLKANVSLLGSGAKASGIQMDAASGGLLVVVSSTELVQVSDLALTNAQNNASALVTIPADPFIVFSRCFLGGEFTTGKIIDITVNTGTCWVVCSLCRFELNATGTKAIDSDIAGGSSGGFLYVAGCQIDFTGTACTTSGVIEAENAVITGCLFTPGAVTSGAFTLIKSGRGGAAFPDLTVTGNRFGAAGAGSTLTIFDVDISLGGAAIFYESDNTFQLAAGDQLYSLTGTPTSSHILDVLASRSVNNQVAAQTATASPKTIDVLQAEYVELQVTGLTALTINANLMPLGTTLVVHVDQDATGTLVVTWGANFVAAGTVSIAANMGQTIQFRSQLDSGTLNLKWVQVGAASGDMT